MGRVACAAILLALFGCADEQEAFAPQPMADKACQASAESRAEAVAYSRYDRDLAPKVFRDAYDECVNARAFGGGAGKFPDVTR